MASAEAAVLKAVLAALKAVCTPTPVHDHVPQGTGYPYVELGAKTSAPYDTKTTDGKDITLTIHSWTSGSGSKPCLDLMEQVRTALHHQTLTLDGHTAINTRVIFEEDMQDPEDPEVYHGATRIRVLTQAD